jgi:hypothetical protein
MVKLTFTPCKIAELFFTLPIFLDYPLAMLTNFGLPCIVNFLLMWQKKINCHVVKVHCHINKKLTFFYHISKKKAEHGKSKFVNIARK